MTRVSDIPNSAFKTAVLSSTSISQIIQKLDLYSDGPNYHRIKSRICELNISLKKKITTKSKLPELVPESSSMTDLIVRLELSRSPNNYKRLKLQIKELGLDIDHWKKPIAIKRSKSRPRKKQSLSQILIVGSKVPSSRLRRRLIKEKILKEECFFEDCPTRKIKNWRGKPVKFELDHINGNHSDNRLINIRILCSICHSQTPTHSKQKSPKIV